MILSQLLSSVADSKQEEGTPQKNMQLANLSGNGVMTIAEHRAYENATGESMIPRRTVRKKEVTRTAYQRGEDDRITKEWRARNKARQDADLQRLLVQRNR